ncbi:MAG: hypothetical protein ACKPKO_19755, partial [Candidatus Fonsibacter sp.]
MIKTILQLDAAKATAALDAAISQAALPPAAATSSTDPHGSRQGDVAMETPSEAPVSTVFMRMDTDELEPPDLVTTYAPGLEEPSMFDADSATVFSAQIWPAVEKKLDTMSPAELEEAKREVRAEEWRKMMEAHQARSFTGIAGHWQVEGIPGALEGTPMILSFADDGRVLANSMR